MWKGLVHIRESEVYLNVGELLYNVIAVYIITVLVKISAKFESHYNLLAVSRYLSTIFPQQISIFKYSRLKHLIQLLLYVFFIHSFIQVEIMLATLGSRT